VSWLTAAVLGLVQGLTEFLPISSSAHLRIVAALAGWPDPGAAFTAVTQLGTETAVLAYFRRDIATITATWARSLRTPSLRRDPAPGSAGSSSSAPCPSPSSDSRCSTPSRPRSGTCGSWPPP
jgi:hypothetical protein